MTATPTQLKDVWSDLLSAHARSIPPSLFMLLRQQARLDPASAATDLIVLIPEVFYDQTAKRFHFLQDAVGSTARLTLKPTATAPRKATQPRATRRTELGPLPAPPRKTFRASTKTISDQERVDDAARLLADHFQGAIIRRENESAEEG